jgi:hypothetical protein
VPGYTVLLRICDSLVDDSVHRTSYSTSRPFLSRFVVWVIKYSDIPNRKAAGSGAWFRTLINFYTTNVIVI